MRCTYTVCMWHQVLGVWCDWRNLHQCTLIYTTRHPNTPLSNIAQQTRTNKKRTDYTCSQNGRRLYACTIQDTADPSKHIPFANNKTPHRILCTYSHAVFIFKHKNSSICSLLGGVCGFWTICASIPKYVYAVKFVFHWVACTLRSKMAIDFIPMRMKGFWVIGVAHEILIHTHTHTRQMKSSGANNNKKQMTFVRWRLLNETRNNSSITNAFHKIHVYRIIHIGDQRFELTLYHTSKHLHTFPLSPSRTNNQTRMLEKWDFIKCVYLTSICWLVIWRSLCQRSLANSFLHLATSSTFWIFFWPC